MGELGKKLIGIFVAIVILCVILVLWDYYALQGEWPMLRIRDITVKSDGRIAVKGEELDCTVWGYSIFNNEVYFVGDNYHYLIINLDTYEMRYYRWIEGEIHGMSKQDFMYFKKSYLFSHRDVGL